MKSTVRQVLKSKGNEVWTIDPDATVYKALQVMAEKEVGALVVTKKSQIIGILSERDYARKVILEGKISKESPVYEMMTQMVLYVNPDTTIDECMILMTEKHVRHLPVLETGRLVGIISIGDVVKKFVSDQKFFIDQLENYITGQA